MTLLRSMKPTLHHDLFVFIHLHSSDNPPSEVVNRSVFTFRESEGNTYVLPRNIVERLGYQFEFPCRMITLAVHSSLSAVGFLAVILKHLAEDGHACNVASGFFHDHLFVPDGEEEKVMELLHVLASAEDDTDNEDEVEYEEVSTEDEVEYEEVSTEDESQEIIVVST